MTGSKFSAGPAATGYLYQVRFALLSALRRLRTDPDFQVALETLDDVVFEKSGEAPDLLQTKHHLRRGADLSDASPDLWKTLRVWAEGIARGHVATASQLYLVTTSSASHGSAAAYLRDDGVRDPARALTILSANAGISENAGNKPSYTAFLGLSLEQRQTLVGAVHVIDRAPNIIDLEPQLAQELLWAVERRWIGAFVPRLEGWWFRRVVRQLAATTPVAILAQDLEAQISDLREQFRRDNLPIDEDLKAIQVDLSSHEGKTFVHQVKLIELTSRRILIAVREYFRAFEQRSRWLREDLLHVGELDNFERRLVEEWEIHFESMRQELGDPTTDAQKTKAAQALYSWVETAEIPIRQSCTEPFVTRGSFHMLADSQRVGWHPEFRDRLRALLERGANE